jgi:hypothetical protein
MLFEEVRLPGKLIISCARPEIWFIRASLLLMIIGSSCMAQTAQPKKDTPFEQSLVWTQFKSEEGRFSVQFPGQPKFERLTYTTGKSSLVHNTFSIELGAFVWLVDYADLPMKTFDARDADVIFNQARDQLLRDFNASLRHQKSLTLEKHLGSEVVLDIAGGQAWIRLYLVQNRLFQLLVTRLDLLSNEQEPSEKFLNSFKLNPRPLVQMSSNGIVNLTS